MKRFFRRYAERQAADVFNERRLIWRLFDSRFLQVKLIVQYRSDVEDCELQGRWHIRCWVFDGDFREHRRGNHAPKEATTFYHVAQNGVVWTGATYRSPVTLHYRPGDCRTIELFEPRGQEERMIDLPWMSHDQIVKDAERPVWAITIGWGIRK